jgi:hypothetical protein
MSSILGYAGQAVFYAAAAVLTGFLASQPDYHQVPEGTAQIKLALSHGGKRVEECRRLTPEELAKLPTNRRRPIDCSRARLPVAVRIVIDGAPIYEAALEPTGLSGDGPARAYEKFLVPAGRHEIVAELRDSNRAEGFDYHGRIEAELKPWQNLAIEFHAEQGGFQFR